MEEKELFGEIKPLIEEYKEYANQETPDMWSDILEDIKISDKSREEGKVYTADRELEIMKMLNVMDTRRKLVEELVQIREAKKQEMRSTIFEKVGAFINDTREKMNQEIEEKRQELEKQKEEKRENFEKKQQELEEKQQILKDMRKKSKAYKDEAEKIKGNKMLEEGLRFFLDKNKEINVSIYDLNKDVKALEKECETLKFEYEDFSIENDEGLQELVNRLNEFDNTYGNINFESEDAIEYIGEMVENYKEEDEIHKLTEDEVEVEKPEKVVTMEDLEQIKEEEKKAWEIYDEENKKQEEKNKKQIEAEWKKHDEKNEKINAPIRLKQELRERLDEIEAGNKDLLVSRYFQFRDNANDEKDIKQVLKILEGKKLLDIYEGLLVHTKNSSAKKELEDAISKIKAREKGEKPIGANPKQAEKKQANAQTKARAQKPTGTNPKPTNAKPTETKQPKTKTAGAGTVEPQAIMHDGKVYDKDGKEVNATVQDYMDMSYLQTLKEEREERLAELKAGFEDIIEVDGNYIALENNLRSYESIEDIEWVLASLEGKHILDIYEGMLAESKTPEDIEDLKNIINQLEERAEKLDLEKLVKEIGEPLQEEINPEEVETLEYDPDIEIRYRADKDKYSIINKDTNERDITEYNKISPMTIEQIVEKYELYGEFEEGIDPAIVAILEKFDEKNGTNKTEKYLKAVTKIGESKEDRQEDMEYAKIAIKYNLTGLYDKKYGFSKEERNSILEMANRAERNGIATVKKGIKVKASSLFEKVTNKLFSKKVALGNGKSKQKKEEMDGYMKSMNNAAKSVTSKNPLQQQIHVEVNEQQAIKAVEAKAELEQPEVEQEKA